MSKTITKQLKLQAVLEDKKLKQQLKALQKELDGLEISGSQFQGFDKSVKALSEAASTLKQTVAEMRKMPGIKVGGMGGTRGGMGVGASSKQEIKTLVEEITKNTSNKNQSFFDADKAKYVNMRPGEVFDKQMGKKFKSEMHHEQAKAKFKEREESKEFKRKETNTKKILKEEAKLKAAERVKDMAAAKDTITAGLSRTGMGLPMARQVSSALGNVAPGLVSKAGGMARGAGAMLAGGAGVAAGAVAGAVAAPFLVAGIGNSYIGRERKLRTLRAQSEQAGATAGFGGDALSGIVGDRARERGQSGFSGFAGGLSQTGSDLFSINPANWARALTGKSYSQGKIQSGVDEAESAAAETQLANMGLKSARGLRQSRVDALRGGGITGDTLTTLQGIGAGRGFSGEETLNQFRTARQFLGNKGAAGALEGMQSMYNKTGISIEDQASGIETLTGTQRGQGYAEGQTQMQEILKKGVAAGLDVSKSGKFLKITADVLRSQQGLGQIDAGGISTSLAESAMGFAGGGPVTATSLGQAAQLQSQLFKESTATGGMAGLGNLGGLQEALGGQGGAGTLLALQNLSKNATDDDIQSILDKGGVTGVGVDQIRSIKENALAGGLGMAGIDPDSNLGLALGSREAGNTTEGQLGRRRARGASGLDLETAGARIDAAAVGGGDMESLTTEFKAQHQAFSQGLGVMTGETLKAQESLKKWVLELEKSIRVMREQTGMQTLKNTGN